MNMFEEIDLLKKDLPKTKTVFKEVNSIELNIYQRKTIVMFIIENKIETRIMVYIINCYINNGINFKYYS